MQTEGLIFTNSNLDQAQLKAQEEERQKREAEEKEAQLEKKREEKRLKKMVSSFCLVGHLSREACYVWSYSPMHLPSPENFCLEQSFLTSTLFSTLLNNNLLIAQILTQLAFPALPHPPLWPGLGEVPFMDSEYIFFKVLSWPKSSILHATENELTPFPEEEVKSLNDVYPSSFYPLT